jgi:hypothetical protein
MIRELLIKSKNGICTDLYIELFCKNIIDKSNGADNIRELNIEKK